MRLLLLLALAKGDAPKRLQQTTYALKAAARGGLVIGVAVAGGAIALLILAVLIYCLHKGVNSETVLAIELKS